MDDKLVLFLKRTSLIVTKSFIFQRARLEIYKKPKESNTTLHDFFICE